MRVNEQVLHHLQAIYERETRMKRTASTIGLFAAGAAFGAAIMAVFTSRPGRQMRASVASRTQGFVNPFGRLHEEVTRPELLARIAADERAELAAKVRALNEDDIDVDSALPMHRERGIV